MTSTIKLAIWNGTIQNQFIKTIVSMDPSGRLVVPKGVRQALNVPDRAVFKAGVFGNRIELTPEEAPPAKLRRKGKLLNVPRQGVASDTVKAVEATRGKRI
jgi:bifunctional DNA-binding transcriptional regulator/antitoxin component of YhaV-PrlF toxin-antitoxin module